MLPCLYKRGMFAIIYLSLQQTEIYEISEWEYGIEQKVEVAIMGLFDFLRHKNRVVETVIEKQPVAIDQSTEKAHGPAPENCTKRRVSPDGTIEAKERGA